jgi:hypothetical protein
MARSVGLEPTTSASAGLRSIRTELRARKIGASHVAPVCLTMVPKVGFEPTRPYGHCALNAARLPFRHFGPYLLSGGRYWIQPVTSGV